MYNTFLYNNVIFVYPCDLSRITFGTDCTKTASLRLSPNRKRRPSVPGVNRIPTVGTNFCIRIYFSLSVPEAENVEKVYYQSNRKIYDFL